MLMKKLLDRRTAGFWRTHMKDNTLIQTTALSLENGAILAHKAAASHNGNQILYLRS